MEEYDFTTDYASWRRENGITAEPEVPAFCGSRFSLQELWNAVQALGGSRRVSEGRLWATVGRRFHPPPTMTNFSFRIKNLFADYLLDYERSIDADRAMLPPMDIAKNRSGRSRFGFSKKPQNGYRSEPQPLSSLQSPSPVPILSNSLARNRNNSSSDKKTPLEEYQEAMDELERAADNCEYLMNLLKETFNEAKLKAHYCQKAYKRLRLSYNYSDEDETWS